MMWAGSLVRQSDGLLIHRPRVQIPSGPLFVITVFSYLQGLDYTLFPDPAVSGYPFLLETVVCSLNSGTLVAILICFHVLGGEVYQVIHLADCTVKICEVYSI